MKNSMIERSFVDTNILIYADDVSAGEKQDKAASLLDSGIVTGRAVFSLQVFQEYFSAAVKKLGLTPEIARRTVELYATQAVVRFDPEDVLESIDLHRLYGFSIWDCLIVQAALKGGCKILYTEDLQHDQVIRGLRVVNPFLS